MAHYLVHAVAKRESLTVLEQLVHERAFAHLQPFGETLTASLRDARLATDGRAVWEEEDYCTPPLAEERAAVLDAHFEALQVEKVRPGEGWARIRSLPRLFPALAEDGGDQ